MRKDLGKVLTEKPRSGSSSRNLKTGFHENGFDSRESAEDKYSLPKRGKMLMHSRDFGYGDYKDFTDVLNPLRRWVESQVGRNWDKVYSEIKNTLPVTNLQNHHIVDTHLMDYIHRNVRVEKSNKGRKVFEESYFYDGKHRELSKGDIYVDPDTHVLMKYKRGQERISNKDIPKYSTTGFLIKNGQIQLEDGSYLENINGCWIRRKYDKTEHRTRLNFDPNTDRVYTTYEMVVNHPLSKKELKHFGIENSLPCDGKFEKLGRGYYEVYKCNKCEAIYRNSSPPKKHGVETKERA